MRSPWSRHVVRRMLPAVATFWLACGGDEPVVPPTRGTIEVTTSTTGEEPDPDGYRLVLDGADLWPIGTEAAATLAELEPGEHQVGLTGVAANCEVEGANPRTTDVAAGETTTEAFTVTCAEAPPPPPSEGTLQVTITGLPGGTDATVAVIGPSGYDTQLTASASLDGLLPGQYTVTATDVTTATDVYTPAPRESDVAVAAGLTAEAAVTYIAEPRPSLNLWIDGFRITQSVQTPDNQVPLIAGRDGYLRVFALANEANTAAPTVRVRLYDDATLVETFTIATPGGAVPTQRDESTLGGSWNVAIPASLIRPGLRVLAELDPEGTIREGDESDNRFPLSGTPRALDVRTAPPLALTLVPVRQSANDLQGDVTGANRDSYLDLSRRIHPIPGHAADVHAVFTTAGPLQPNDGNGAWGTLLSEIDALRVAEGTGRLYYGVVRLDYTGGQVARSLTGTPAAVGFDDTGQRSRMTAHGLGHMWGRDHAPCGNPQALDPNYPYAGGEIGVYGFDVEDQLLKSPTSPDIMGLCRDGVWVSDYTYTGVMNFRGTGPGMASATAGARPSVLVWGRITRRGAVLEPALRVVAPPSLPSRPGSYSVEGITGDGGRAFRFSFDPVPVADGARGEGHFAFAVPLDERTGDRLESIRLAGPGTGIVALARRSATLRAPPVGREATLSAASRGATLRWDAAAYPVVMVRDAGSGQVLSFARGGQVLLPAEISEVELVMSDGVRSRHARVRR